MAFWKVQVIKKEYSFVIIESDEEPNNHVISLAAEELQGFEWVDTEFEIDEPPHEVDESYADEYNIFKP